MPMGVYIYLHRSPSNSIYNPHIAHGQVITQEQPSPKLRTQQKHRTDPTWMAIQQDQLNEIWTLE